MPSHMQSRHYGIMDFKFKVALERESKSPFEAELYESRTVFRYSYSYRYRYREQ